MTSSIQLKASDFFVDCPSIRNYPGFIHRLDSKELDADPVNKAGVFRAIIFSLLDEKNKFEAEKLFQFGEATNVWNPTRAISKSSALKIKQFKEWSSQGLGL